MKTGSVLTWLLALALVGCGNDDSKLSQARGFGAGPGFTQANSVIQGGAATFSSATVTGDTTLADLVDQGAFVLTGSIAPASTTGEIHDWNPCDATTTTKCLASAALADRTSLVRIALSGNLIIDSLAAPSPATGQVTCFENTSSTFSVTFVNEESVNTTSALDRLTLPNSANWVVPPNGGMCTRYSAAATRWKPWQSNNNNLMGTTLAVTGTSTLAGVTATSINDSGALSAGASTLGATTVTTLGISSVETGSTAQSAEVRGDVAASATVPTLIGNQVDTTTGLGGANQVASLIVNNTEMLRANTSGIFFQLTNSTNGGGISGSFGLVNKAASATQPTLVPNKGASTTGIGADVSGDVSIIVGGVEWLRFWATNTVIDAIKPIQGDTGNSYELMSLTAASATAPTVVPNRADTTTGIGANATGALDLIAGGVDEFRCTANGCTAVTSKNKGSITLSAGTGTATVLSGSTCVCGDATAVNAVKCSNSAGTLTATGTGTDVINYICL